MVLELFAFPVMVVGLFAFAFAFTVTVLGLFAFTNGFHTAGKRIIAANILADEFDEAIEYSVSRVAVDLLPRCSLLPGAVNYANSDDIVELAAATLILRRLPPMRPALLFDGIAAIRDQNRDVVFPMPPSEFMESVRQQTDAAARARLLLHEWLSPAQRTQYAASGGFVVTGCDSGKSYRIQWGFRNFNVLEMDGKRIVARWCFQPSGGLVTADVVLAQKIALETREFEALKLANRDPPRVCTCLNIAAPAVPALSTAPLPQYRS